MSGPASQWLARRRFLQAGTLALFAGAAPARVARGFAPTDPVGTTAFATGTSTVNASFDLSGAAFNNLTGGITFRIDVRDSGSTASNASVRIDDIAVAGEVVPEPGSASLLAATALGCLLIRRRNS